MPTLDVVGSLVAAIACALPAAAQPFPAAAQPIPAATQCGAWAGGFEPGGLDGPAVASVVYDDGSGPALYVGGGFATAGGLPARAVARWDGTAWSALGGGPPGFVNALAVFDFGAGPRLVAGGGLSPTSTATDNRLYTWDGSTWAPYGPPLVNPLGDTPVVRALTVFDDGTGPALYAAGGFLGAVARWTGSAWSTVGAGLYNGPFDPSATAASLVVHAQNGGAPELYAGGSFDRTGSEFGSPTLSNVARFSGGSWVNAGSLRGTIDHETSLLASFDDGTSTRLVAAGILYVGGQQRSMAASSGAGGWSALGDYPLGDVGALRVVPAGQPIASGLWIGGDFDAIGSVAADDVARFDGASWHAVGGAHGGGSVACLEPFDDGGGVRMHSLTSSGTLSRLDAGAWVRTSGGASPNGAVQALVEFRPAHGPRRIFASGAFTSIGDVPAPGLAVFDGASWNAGDLHGFEWLRPLRVLDRGTGPELYFVGRNQAYAPQPYRICRTDGSSFEVLPVVPTHQWGSPLDVEMYDAGAGPQLYASGSYGLWRLDGATWTNVLGLSSRPIAHLLVHDDGSGPALFVAGQFAWIGSVTCGPVARWDGTQLDPLDSVIVNGSIVDALCAYDDGTGRKLYVTGNFGSIGGVTAQGLASWDGASWAPVGGGIGPGFSPGWSLATHDAGGGRGPELVVGGAFTAAGGNPAGRIARWNGTSWDDMQGGVSSYVFAQCTFDDGSGRGADLYVGGHFQRAGTRASAYLARWTSCGGDATTFCHGDGSATACPCGNASQPGDDVGCLNSLGSGGSLRVHGRASLADDTLVLEGGGMTNSSALYYQGANLAFGGQGSAVGDGVKCVAGPFVRLRTKTNVGGASRYPESADSPVSVRGFVTTAGTRHYQVHYRNAAAFCSPETYNHTNAVTIVWGL